ncbi:MAG: tetratricopeptide repeat protein [Desulfobacterales bacterium]|nr:tetratricopeptide repeat protein [Desulfobacterales bacterium]
MIQVYKIHVICAAALVIMAGLYAGTAMAAVPGPPLSLQAGITLNRAQALFGQGEIKKAIAVLESFACPTAQNTSKGCNHPYLFFTLGNYYAARAKEAVSEDDMSRAYKQAVQSYKAALRTTPGFSEAWLNLAAVCHGEGLHKEAALAFEKGYLYGETPRPVHLYYAAVCHFQSGNSPRALELFAMLEQRHPDRITPAWREVLVHVLFSMNRRKEALSHIEMLADTPWPEGPGNRQKKWREILINQYLSLDMDEKALAYGRKLTRNDPLEARWWKALSHVHLKHNRLDKGLSGLIAYSFLSPLTPEEKMLAADLYFSLDIPARAADLYESLVKEDRGQVQKTAVTKLIQARTMARDTDTALKWINAVLDDRAGKYLLTEKGAGELNTLKQQLLQIQKFHAAAGRVLPPSPAGLNPVTPEKE